MDDKKPDDKKQKASFSDSSEIFESIFKEATSEIQRETGKVVAQPGLKPKPKPEVKPKQEAKPKAPTKLEIESTPEPKTKPLQEKPRSEQKPRLQPPTFKPRHDPARRPVTVKPGAEEGRSGEPLLSSEPLLRSRIQEKKPEEKPGGKLKKPKPFAKDGKSSSLLRVVLLLVLLALGVGAGSVYLGILDLSEYIGWPEPPKKEPPKVTAKKPSQAQPAAKTPPQPAPTPADASKAPAPPQTVQPPQPPPATPVVPPPQPPEVQPKPGVASPPVQPPAKAEPPSATVQAPAKAQPQASAPQVQPPVKREPEAPPAPPKKVETPQPASPPKEVPVAKSAAPARGSGVAYPYSVYLGSFQSMEYLQKAISVYEKQGLSAYWTQVNLGPKGTWYRVYTGYFRSAQEAEAFIQQKKIKDGEVKETKYTNLIGTFGTKQAGDEKALALTSMGVSGYSVQAADGQVKVYSGVFSTREGAEKNQAELSAKGIRSEVVER